jgi:hypothetical protein
VKLISICRAAKARGHLVENRSWMVQIWMRNQQEFLTLMMILTDYRLARSYHHIVRLRLQCSWTSESDTKSSFCKLLPTLQWKTGITQGTEIITWFRTQHTVVSIVLSTSWYLSPSSQSELLLNYTQVISVCALFIVHTITRNRETPQLFEMLWHFSSFSDRNTWAEGCAVY